MLSFCFWFVFFCCLLLLSSSVVFFFCLLLLSSSFVFFFYRWKFTVSLEYRSNIDKQGTHTLIQAFSFFFFLLLLLLPSSSSFFLLLPSSSFFFLLLLLSSSSFFFFLLLLPSSSSFFFFFLLLLPLPAAAELLNNAADQATVTVGASWNIVSKDTDPATGYTTTVVPRCGVVVEWQSLASEEAGATTQRFRIQGDDGQVTEMNLKDTMEAIQNHTTTAGKLVCFGYIRCLGHCCRQP
jgi:hypothetical protein